MPIDFEKLLDDDVVEVRVPVREWGDDVRMLRPEPGRLIEFASLAEDDQLGDGLKITVFLVSITIADDEGNRPFDSERGRLYLYAKPLIVSQLHTHALALCGLSEADVEMAKKN